MGLPRLTTTLAHVRTDPQLGHETAGRLRESSGGRPLRGQMEENLYTKAERMVVLQDREPKLPRLDPDPDPLNPVPRPNPDEPGPDVVPPMPQIDPETPQPQMI